MKLIAEIDCGWIKCDICGDGRNYLVLRGEGGRYSLERISECYPNVLLEDLTRDEMLEAIQENRFIVSTPAALLHLKKTIRRIKREKQVPKSAPKQNVGVLDPGHGFTMRPTPDSFWRDQLNFMDIGRAAGALSLTHSWVVQPFTWNDGVTID